MVDMKVFGLAVDQGTQAPVLLLKDLGETVVLPIWIGAMEAMSISMALNKMPFHRPMTHDLLLAMVQRLGGTVESVEILRITDSTFFAEILLRTPDGEVVRMDARPSDAVALAVRLDCPVRAAGEVLEQAGVPDSERFEAAISDDDAEKWSDELERLSDDENKYKM